MASFGVTRKVTSAPAGGVSSHFRQKRVTVNQAAGREAARTPPARGAADAAACGAPPRRPPPATTSAAARATAGMR